MAIRDCIRGFALDPYSIRDAARDAAVSNSWRTDADLKGYGMRQFNLCIRYNSKNEFGAYRGRTSYVLLVRDGKVVDVEPSKDECSDSNRVTMWLPLPEIPNLASSLFSHLNQ